MSTAKTRTSPITPVRDWDSESLGIWFSAPLPAEHPIYLALRVMDMREYFSETEMERDQIPNYNVSILAVSPGFARETDAWTRALDCVGMTEGDLPPAGRARISAEIQVLVDYGAYATLWQENGNNRNALVEQARQAFKGFQIFGGFALDRTQNAIGATGWDFIQGNPTGPLYR